MTLLALLGRLMTRRLTIYSALAFSDLAAISSRHRAFLSNKSVWKLRHGNYNESGPQRFYSNSALFWQLAEICLHLKNIFLRVKWFCCLRVQYNARYIFMWIISLETHPPWGSFPWNGDGAICVPFGNRKESNYPTPLYDSESFISRKKYFLNSL